MHTRNKTEDDRVEARARKDYKQEFSEDAKYCKSTGCVIPVLTYCAETLTIITEIERETDALDVRRMIRIMKISHKENATNEKRTQQIPLSEREMKTE